MKNSLLVVACAGSLFLTVNSWNDFTWRYSAAGHIPSIPLYFKEPVKTCPSRAELAADIKSLQQELAALRQGADREFGRTAQSKEKQTRNGTIARAKKAKAAHHN